MDKNKLYLYKYDDRWPIYFEKYKKQVQDALNGYDFEIHHMGSTAVPDLGGKGIIDIMIALPSWDNEKEIIDQLSKLGYTHIHPKENERIFASKNHETKNNDAHFHIVLINYKDYNEILFFRDYLRKHPDEVKKYFELKQKLYQSTNANRKKYKKLKSDYINKILSKYK